MKKPPLYRSLYFQVITAIILGVLLGHYYPESGAAMKPLGDGFIKLIKMMIAPIIFCTVVVGIAGMEDMKKVGKTGGMALLYFEVVSTLALIIGLVVVNVLQPGAGMNVDLSKLNAKEALAYAGPGKLQGIVEYLMAMIPSTIFDAFAKGDILQILVVAVLFGFALHRFGGRGTLVFDMVEKTSHVLFVIVGYIMKAAPIGAFGAMAFTIGKYGVGSLLSLGYLMASFYITCLIFIFGVLGTVAYFHGFSIWKFVKYIKEELLIVLGTSSSESALPGMIAKLEKLGVKKSVVGLVIPTGYSFNLDGTAIYLTMAAVFIAQATNTPLTIGHQISLLIFLLVASKGAAGITGSGFIVLAATLSSTGTIPVEGLALILGIDRFMSEARALTNLVGNGVATIVVAKWGNDVDNVKMQKRLNNDMSDDVDAYNDVEEHNSKPVNLHMTTGR
ncbi:dicarboxylate/amino acid:cation symporter [Undibacterium sp. 5I1]|uniref:dicarboxylate/amino acid:cation symporter n=1 Tax=unclassified Undibacterium TaxID=2630295 RepID=UPI002AB4498C|nr:MULTISPECIES: dicarboxylate/amino acid:cation symporter [unclassified Undibacterium]MDY7539845.1 dicarboxylate/amino acid:cation symporter [Undibacterium sp. 5I1]MEB0232335.1 dicarboxylate/amino acid:cation symporter [Undibacterium sp. 10I3]MEB0256881.1 dicarboxylate/amino acid:cation symporter [Undibacterium sp. 5I1]